MKVFVALCVLVGSVIVGLAFGAVSAAWAHGHDAPWLPNLLGVLLGDELSRLSIRLIGDPHSPHAARTVPWVLQRPQIYLLSSVLFWGGLGALGALAALFRPRRYTQARW